MTMEVEETTSVVPENVMESVRRTLTNVQDISANFDEFLSLCDPENLDELPPLQRAQSLLTLARLTTGLFAVSLRCSGVHPEDHRLSIKGEIERISLYQGKLERYLRLSKAPLLPSTKLNYQAANRVIQHSLPDLSDEQRQSLRDLSKKEGGRISYINTNMQKKRKYHSLEKNDKPSVRAAAQEFLEKAARELLGEMPEGVQGPVAPTLIQDSSDDEDLEEEREEKEEDDFGEEHEDEDVMACDAPASAPILIGSSEEN